MQLQAAFTSGYSQRIRLAVHCRPDQNANPSGIWQGETNQLRLAGVRLIEEQRGNSAAPAGLRALGDQFFLRQAWHQQRKQGRRTLCVEGVFQREHSQSDDQCVRSARQVWSLIDILPTDAPRAPCRVNSRCNARAAS